jgi:calpain
LIHFYKRMSEEDIELPEEGLGEEEIEERDTFSENQVDTVDSPLLDFFLGGGLSSGGRQRSKRVQQGEIDRNDPVVENGRLYGQDFSDLRAAALDSGQLFQDPEFPPDGDSIFFSKSAYGLEWMRPHELVDDPRLMVGGGDRFDINQGELGDCWLLAAMANLTMNKKVRSRVIPLDQSFSEEYAGIFHFKFWQYGEWVDVVIDDYLPTRNGKLVFMQSDSTNEFWSALFEKAYAKLHGSYESLKGGTTLEAMVDFTGGCTEMFDLNQPPRDLFTILIKAFERCSLMGCSLEPEPGVTEARTEVGLVRGHAYSVTKVVKAKIETPRVSGEIPLVRIRNPWGNEAEWNGAWSDGSPEWRYVPDEEKENLGLNFEDDGEFWMSYKDFLKYFDQLEICNLNPDSLDGDNNFKWEVATFPGAWIAGDTAGGCRNNIGTFASNPQYLIMLEDPDEEDEHNKCTVIINLMQKGRRAMRDEGMDLLTIGFCIYHLKDAPDGRCDTAFFKYNASCARSKTFINLREMSARFRLPPGAYCIVPSTFAPDQEGEFLIRVFTEKPNNAAVM